MERLRKDIKVAKDPKQIKNIDMAAKKIKEEQRDKWKVGAREALIKAAKNGRVDEERAIGDDIIERNMGPVGLDRITVQWRPGQYEEIFGHD